MVTCWLIERVLTCMIGLAVLIDKEPCFVITYKKTGQTVITAFCCAEIHNIPSDQYLD